MTILATGVGQVVSAGKYNLSVDWTSGTVTVTTAVNGGGHVAVPSGVFSADGNVSIDLPRCEIKQVATGTAVVELNLITKG